MICLIKVKSILKPETAVIIGVLVVVKAVGLEVASKLTKTSLSLKTVERIGQNDHIDKPGQYQVVYSIVNLPLKPFFNAKNQLQNCSCNECEPK